MKNIVLIILIAVMAGVGLYYYFIVGPNKTLPVTKIETVAPAQSSTNPNDLDKEMSQIVTDDTSVTLDATVDTAGL